MVTKIRAKPDEPTIGTLLLSLICLAINVHNVQYLGICRLMKDNRHYSMHRYIFGYIRGELSLLAQSFALSLNLLSVTSSCRCLLQQ